MSARQSDEPTPRQRLDEVLAEYMQRVDRGEQVDREALLAEHPDLAGELRSYFEAAEQVERMAGAPVEEAAGAVDLDAETIAPTSRERKRAGRQGDPMAPAGAQDETIDTPAPDTGTVDAEAPTVAPGDAASGGKSGKGVPPVSSTGPGDVIRYFGDYELLEEIARGGMGVVYKARQVSLNRIVAVKMILAGQLASEADVNRFYTEAEAAANLQHPNIVAIHEVGQHEGQHYFSMDYVEGKSLADLVREHPLPAKQAAAYVKTIAEAIHYAHEQGTLHRDLKPSNVLIDTNDRPRITDFGLAKRLSPPPSVGEGEGGGAELAGLTATGAALGTPSYMPPEQASGKRGEIGPQSDVYSLGAILYELLTGRPPFRADTPLDTMLQVLESEPASPRLLNPKIDRDLETISLKCLQKESQSRYASATELAEDLGRFLRDEPIAARPVGAWERTVKWARRQPAVASWIAIVPTLLIVVMVGTPHAAMVCCMLAAMVVPMFWSVRNMTIAGALCGVAGGAGCEFLLGAELEDTLFWSFLGGSVGTLIGVFAKPLYAISKGISGKVSRPIASAVLWTAAIALAMVIGIVVIGRLGVGGFLFPSIELSSISQTPGLMTDVTFFAFIGGVLGLLAGDIARGMARSIGNDPATFLFAAAVGIFCGVLLNTVTAPVFMDVLVPDVGIGWVRTQLDPFVPRVIEGGIYGGAALLGGVLACLTTALKRFGQFATGFDRSMPMMRPSPPCGAETVTEPSRDHARGAQLWLTGARRRPVLAGACVTMGLMAIFATVAITWQWRRAEWALRSERARAQAEANLYKLARIASAVALDAHKVPLDGIAFSPDGNQLASVGYDFALNLWDTEKRRILRTMHGLSPGEQDRIRSTTFSESGRLPMPMLIPYHSAVAFSPDGSQMAAGAREQVKVWEVSTGREVQTLRGLSGFVTRVRFSPDGARLVAASGGMVRMWARNSGHELFSLVGEYRSVAFSPNGDRIVTVGGLTANIWDARNGDELLTLQGSTVQTSRGQIRRFNSDEGHRQSILDVAWSPNGQWIATSSMDTTVRIWNAATGAPVRALDGHAGSLNAVAFSRDSRWIFTGSDDGSLRISDVPQGQVVVALNVQKGAVMSIAVSPCGRWIASGSADGTLTIWKTPTGYAPTEPY